MNEVIIALAKAAILVALNQPEHFDLQKSLKQYPILEQEGAVFVTIKTKKDDTLRGCIGSLTAHRPLYKDIILNTKAAALKDPRFKPLTTAELPNITLEVALLSTPTPLTYKDPNELKEKVVPRQDGVVLRYKNYQATYLPSVWEDLPTFEHFFSSLCQKAKLQKNCLEQHPDILLYQVTKYKEK